MNFTNKHNLPKYLVDWLLNDNYDYNSDPLTLSATTLMKPVRAYWITKRYNTELEMDVSDLLASRLGNAIHDSVDKVTTANVSKEQRITRELVVDDVTYTITGKYDVLEFDNGKWRLRDIKTTSVWTYIFGGKDEDYRKQLSIYRWLLENRHPVEDIACIDFIFTDWSSTKAKQDKDSYPQQRLIPGYKVELFSIEETQNYLESRVREIFKYQNTPSESLPYCTSKELWAEEDTFAVKKPGKTRASRVFKTKEEANKYIYTRRIKASVLFRKGRAKRCKYCSASPYCSQFKELQQKNLVSLD